MSKNIRKSTESFILLIMLFSSVYNYATEQQNENNDTMPIEITIFGEIVPPMRDNEGNSSRVKPDDFFNDCYRNNDAQACQKLIALAAFTAISERARFQGAIAEQGKTIATHEKTINNFNEIERRRSVRIAVRAAAKIDKKMLNESGDCTIIAETGLENVIPVVMGNEDSRLRIQVDDLLNGCYRENDAQACQQLIALAAYRTIAERAEFQETITAQRKTIAVHEQMIDNHNERHRGLYANRNGRKAAAILNRNFKVEE